MVRLTHETWQVKLSNDGYLQSGKLLGTRSWGCLGLHGEFSKIGQRKCYALLRQKTCMKWSGYHLIPPDTTWIS